MRFLLFLLLPVVFVCLNVQSVLSFDDIKVVASGVDMGLGYRSDQLDWAISADSDSGTLSELRWDDLDIFQVQTRPLFHILFYKVSLSQKKKNHL